MKIFLYIILFTLFSIQVQAATRHVEEPEISIGSMLVNIDKTDFTTNVLHDKTTPWSQLITFLRGV